MNDFYYFLIAGTVLMLVPIFIISWFQSGFFFHWLRAKSSRGKRVLVKLIKPVKDGFTTGIIEEGFLVFGKKSELRRIKLEGARFYNAWGITAIDIHDELNAPIGIDFRGVSGFDAQSFENLLTRALYRPTLDENKDKMILIAVVVVGLIALLTLALVWSVQGQVTALGQVGQVTGVL